MSSALSFGFTSEASWTFLGTFTLSLSSVAVFDDVSGALAEAVDHEGEDEYAG